jgi:hypothetical protein
MAMDAVMTTAWSLGSSELKSTAFFYKQINMNTRYTILMYAIIGKYMSLTMKSFKIN